MKNLRIVSLAIASSALFSQLSFAEPAVFSGEMQLMGFNGGTCNISVTANANATNLDLHNPGTIVNVGTVNTQCDYNYRLTVDADRNEFGDFALVNSSDEFMSVPFGVMVEGFPKFGTDADSEIMSYPAGDNRQMPVDLDLMGAAPIPGIYLGSVTFSVVVD